MIALKSKIIFSNVLKEMKAKFNHKEQNLQKKNTGKLFSNKVLKQFEENSNDFMEKSYNQKDILKLLEHNFKYKVEHQKKFKKVLNQLHFYFHKQKYSIILKDIKTIINNNANVIELFLVYLFTSILLLKIIGVLFNLSDN